MATSRHVEYRARKRAEVEALKAMAVTQKRDVRLLPMDAITVDARVQMRAAARPEVVAEYADAMQEGAEFPPVVVFWDGATYWLADGFHRHAACVQLEFREVQCDVREGGMRDAILFAAGANAAHGMRRTNADKRRAVESVLDDYEWWGRTDVWIAKACAVTNRLVGLVRSELLNGSTPSEPEVRRREDGSTYTVPAKVTKTVTTVTESVTEESDDDRAQRECDELLERLHGRSTALPMVAPPCDEEQDWDAPGSPFRVDDDEEACNGAQVAPGRPSRDDSPSGGQMTPPHAREGFPGLDSLRRMLIEKTDLDAVGITSVLRVVAEWQASQ